MSKWTSFPVSINPLACLQKLNFRFINLVTDKWIEWDIYWKIKGLDHICHITVLSLIDTDCLLCSTKMVKKQIMYIYIYLSFWIFTLTFYVTKLALRCHCTVRNADALLTQKSIDNEVSECVNCVKQKRLHNYCVYRQPIDLLLLRYRVP